MSATRLKAKIEILQSEKEALNSEKANLLSKSEADKKEFEDKLNIAKEEYDEKLQVIESENETEVEALEEKIQSLTKENKDKQHKIDSREIKKLAEAYREQEHANINDTTAWFKKLLWSGLCLLIWTVFCLFITHGESWTESVKYFVVDIIFVSAVWFCGSQYSNAIKLRDDYANRKTLAQSFHNILNNLAEDEPIRDKFIEKAVGVLCAPTPTGAKEPILSKKVLKDTAEIIGAAAGR